MWPDGVVGGVVDGVDRGGLRRAGRRGHGEVRVAVELAEQRQFVVEAAPAAARQRIVQAPVAVDEREAYLPALRMHRQRAMLDRKSTRLNSSHSCASSMPYP